MNLNTNIASKLIADWKPGDIIYGATSDGRVFSFEVLSNERTQKMFFGIKLALRDIDYRFQLTGNYRETNIPYTADVFVAEKDNRSNYWQTETNIYFSASLLEVLQHIADRFYNHIADAEDTVKKLKRAVKSVNNYITQY